VIGSGFDDTLLGGAASDVLNGSGGNDTVQGLAGDDELAGGAGNDAITGGARNDTAYFSGSRGDYTITAIQGGFNVVDNRADGDGTDIVTEVEYFRFQGNDGDFGNDVVFSASAVVAGPTAGDDYISLGSGNDRIGGLAGNDTLEGWAGDDTLIGGLGDDVLTGFTGHDVAEMGNAGFRGVSVGRSDRAAVITSAAGTDSVINVELVTFADGRLVFDAADPAAQVARLYEAALDRLPDQGG
jgi:Ca2+-binding RTX toxin-like protein